MLQTEPMRSKSFNIRMSEEEAERMARVADHYALPVSGVIRMLIKKEADRLDRLEQETFELDDLHLDILGVLPTDMSVMSKQDIVEMLDRTTGWGQPAFKAFPRLLNELRRAGYIKRYVNGYSLTQKGADLD